MSFRILGASKILICPFTFNPKLYLFQENVIPSHFFVPEIALLSLTLVLTSVMVMHLKANCPASSLCQVQYLQPRLARQRSLQADQLATPSVSSASILPRVLKLTSGHRNEGILPPGVTVGADVVVVVEISLQFLDPDTALVSATLNLTSVMVTHLKEYWPAFS